MYRFAQEAEILSPSGYARMASFSAAGGMFLSLKQLTALFALAAIWGASYIFIRIAVEPVGPVMLMFIRVALSGLILLGYARLRRQQLNIRGHWRQFIVLGFLGSALPFTLIAWAELTVTGSMAAILMSATPLFTTFVAAVGLGEALTPHKLIGAILGIVGVSITVGGSPLALDTRTIAATLALLAATLSYAIGGVYAKHCFQGLDNLSLSTGQLLFAALILAPASVVDLPLPEVSSFVLMATLALVVLCTAFAYQLYYYLVISAGPLQALTVTLLIPVFGLVWGALLLGESISAGMIIGLAVVLFSVGLVTGMISPRRRQLAK
ncbi:MAG: EamA family transporter [Chloroflexi bacterium]|nr:EamA family transporter [Chloroflexota bacterium]MCY3977930.1 EamA family transporter [Chloroflexota bacterium]